MTPTVSVIVPVYNAERTIEHCVESILRQEYTDLELLLMDDGSKDSSGAIMDRYAAKDRRVRVVHKENTGVSDTRNTALALARGTYIQFVDSDDWITPDATKLLVDAAQGRHCDMVISDFYRVAGERVSRKGDIDEDGVLSREEYAAHMMENPADFYYGVLWNKLYRRDIIEAHALRMDPAISWCEDFMFNLEYIRHAASFFALQVPVYYYRNTKGSLASQGLSLPKTIRMKLTVFEVYNQFYKTVLDEEEYEKRRLKVYKFLFDAAQDGAVLPGAKRLGNERVAMDAPAGEGPLHRWLWERKRLEYYLESAALKNGLTLAEALVLQCLEPSGETVASRRELAALTGLNERAVRLALQKLSARDLIRVEDVQGERVRRLRLTALLAAEPVMAELAGAWEAWQRARLAVLSPEERACYAGLTAKLRSASGGGHVNAE